MSLKSISLLLLMLFARAGLAQQTVYLGNLSFEGFPQAAKVPYHWENAGDLKKSPPDSHPSNAFEVYNYAFHGNAYVGMVTRRDGSYEAIGQPLSSPLQPDSCYIFGIYLCRSLTYKSTQSSEHLIGANHKNPVQLEIWGGHPDSRKRELLAKSEAIVNTNWMEYRFKIQARKEWDYIELRANFLDDAKDYYDGNLLMDYASNFAPIDCNQTIKEIDYGKILIAPVEKDSNFNAKLQELSAAHQQSQKKMASFLPRPRNSMLEPFEKLKFVAFSDQWTEDGEAAILEIADYMSYSYSKLIFVLAKGEGTIGEKRMDHLTKSLLDAGLNNRQFDIKRVRPTDLQRDWFSKNLYWWVRFERR